MQDDQISKKKLGLTPADMDRLPLLINTEKNVFSSKQLSPSAGIAPKSSLPCLQGKSSVFYYYILLLVYLNYSDFYGWHSRIHVAVVASL
jgi:hypothetical protein